MSFALIGRVSLFFLPSLAGFRFRPRFPFLPFSLPRPFSPVIPSLSGASKRRPRWTNKPSCKRKRGETETDDGPLTRGSGRGRVCEINNFHGPAKNNTRSVTSYLRKGLRNARRQDALGCVNFVVNFLLNAFSERTILRLRMQTSFHTDSELCISPSNFTKMCVKVIFFIFSFGTLLFKVNQV